MTEELIDHLATDLAEAEYTPVSIANLLGESAHRALAGGETYPARRMMRKRSDSPLRTLVQLLLLGEDVPIDAVDAALPRLTAAGLCRLGIAGRSGAETIRAELSLNAVELEDSVSDEPLRWWIVSDLDDHLRTGAAKPDHVMGVGGATRSLISQLPPTRVDTALDLGTGCGIVALHLALRQARVVATDISARALDLARLNARLNGLGDRIEFRAGSLFEPVAKDSFALIASNPPFVITPRHTDDPIYEYRDGGKTGDALAAEVMQQGPRYLDEQGTLVCLANWESPWGVNGLERVREWIAASEVAGLAAWVIERDRLDPLGYAQMWTRDGGDLPGSSGHERKLAAWLDDFEARRVVSIGLGSIRISRTALDLQEPLVHLEQAAGAFAAAKAGRSLDRAFAAGVIAAQMSDDDVLDATWLRASEVTEMREHEPGVEAPRAITLAIEHPIARRVSADPLLAAAVGACDGDLTLRQIADALASLLEVETEACRAALVASARELAWLGMLSPRDTLEQ